MMGARCLFVVAALLTTVPNVGGHQPTEPISPAARAELTMKALSALRAELLRQDWQSGASDFDWLSRGLGFDGDVQNLEQRRVSYVDDRGATADGARELLGVGETLSDICGIWDNECDGSGTRVKFAFDGYNAIVQQKHLICDDDGNATTATGRAEAAAAPPPPLPGNPNPNATQMQMCSGTHSCDWSGSGFTGYMEKVILMKNVTLEGFVDVVTPSGNFTIHSLGFKAGDTSLYRFSGSAVATMNAGATFLSSSACAVAPWHWYSNDDLFEASERDGGGGCTRWPDKYTDDVANERKAAATAAGFERYDDDEYVLNHERYKAVWINATHPCFGSPALSTPAWKSAEGARQAILEGWDDYKWSPDFGGCFDDDNVHADGFGPEYCDDAQKWTLRFLRQFPFSRDDEEEA